MATKSVMSGKGIGSQAQEIINNVIAFMKSESETGVKIPLENYRQRVIAATGISKNSYQKIAKKGRLVNVNLASRIFTSPSKKRQRLSPILAKITPEISETIREIIYNFYIVEKKRPTVLSILQKIRDSRIDFDGQKTTLNKLLKSMGFRWKTTSDNRKALIEQYDIRLKRIEFLKQMLKYRADERNIVYTDETYIHSSHTQSKGWSDNNYKKELKKPVSKGRRLIIVHAGGEQGFVQNGLLIFKSGSKSGDYHDDMNHTNFLQWVEKQLIPNLPPRSVLVVDNASYHNVTVEKNVTSGSRKADMVNWLRNRNFNFEEKNTKPELLKLIKENKHLYPLKYSLDTLMEQHGHNVLRLPPYHPDLNPIEKIWALVKNWVAARNVTFTLAAVEELARKKFSEVGVSEWTKICGHVSKYEVELCQKEHLLDKSLDELSFTVNTGSSDEDSDFTDSDLGVSPLLTDSD